MVRASGALRDAEPEVAAVDVEVVESKVQVPYKLAEVEKLFVAEAHQKARGSNGNNNLDLAEVILGPSSFDEGEEIPLSWLSPLRKDRLLCLQVTTSSAEALAVYDEAKGIFRVQIALVASDHLSMEDGRDLLDRDNMDL